MVKFAGTSNINSWLESWKRKIAAFDKGIDATPQQVAEWGALKAKTIAPKDTGALIQAISWQTVAGQKTKRAMIFVREMQNPKYQGVRGRVPRYASIHHKLPLKHPNQAKTGDPHWLFTIRNEAKDRFRRGIVGNIQGFK